MNRKSFLKNAGLALTGIPAFYSFSEEKKSLLALSELSSNSERDWSSIYKEFRVNKNIAYLNNGTMGVCPDIVLKTLRDEFERVASQGAYPSDMNRLKSALGRVMNVDANTLAITKNVTEGINIACWGNELKKDDEVLMTTHEHVGGCSAWLYRAKTEGIRLKTFALGKTAEETLQNFKKALTAKTKIIAVPHIPCTVGQILPIKEICKIARERDIISIIDGAHPLGMIRFDIADLDCDYYAGCLHKWLLAPLGMGYIYIHPRRLNFTKIHNLGAYSVSKFDMTEDIPMMKLDELVNGTQRFSSGTFCGPLYEASLKAVEWYESIGIDRIEKRVKELSLQTQEGLEKFGDSIAILSPKEEISRGAQTSFSFKAKDANEFIAFAHKSKYKFTLRHVHEGGLNAVRISTHYYNSEAQIESLMATLGEYLKQ